MALRLAIQVAAALLLASTARAKEVCTDSSPFVCWGESFCREWTDGCNDCSCDWQDETIPVSCTRRVCECSEDNSCIPECKDNPTCVDKNAVINGAVESIEVGNNGATIGEMTINGVPVGSTPAEAPSVASSDVPSEFPTKGSTSAPTSRSSEEEVEETVEVPEVPEKVDSYAVVVEPNNTPEENSEATGEPIALVCPAGSTCTEWFDGCNTCFGDTAANIVAACSKKHCPCYNDNSCVPQCKDNPDCVPKSGVSAFLSSGFRPMITHSVVGSVLVVLLLLVGNIFS